MYSLHHSVYIRFGTICNVLLTIIHLLLNNFKLICWKFLLLFLALFSFSLNTLLSYYSDVLDVLTRLPLNNNYITTLYYTWTLNWWSSVITWLLLTYLLTCILGTLQNGYFILYVIGSMLFLLNTITYWLVNTLDSLAGDNSNHFNQLLVSPLNHYHPNLFLSLLTLTYLILFLIFIFSYQKFLFGYRNYILIKLIPILKKTLPVSLFTTFLGSWWAFQEGSWGGWWNWDLSEVLSLVICFLFTYLVHKGFSKPYTITDYLQGLILVTNLLLLNLIVQYNLTTSTHAFGQEFTRGSIVSRPQTLILLGLFIFTLSYTYLLKLISVATSYKSTFRWELSYWLLNTQVYKFWVYMFSLSILQLFYFSVVKPVLGLPGLYATNLLPYITSWYPQLLLLVLLLLMYYWGWKVYYLVLPFIFTYYPTNLTPLLVPIITSKFYNSPLVNLHLLLLGPILLNTLYLSTTILSISSQGQSSTHLNFLLELDYSVGSGILFDGNLASLTNRRFRSGNLTYETSMLTGLTSFFNNTYLFHFPSEFTENSLTIDGVYVFWLGYEIEFLAPVLGSLSILVVSVLFYLVNKTLYKAH